MYGLEMGPMTRKQETVREVAQLKLVRFSLRVVRSCQSTDQKVWRQSERGQIERVWMYRKRPANVQYCYKEAEN